MYFYTFYHFCLVFNKYFASDVSLVSLFEEIQGHRGCGEDRGGERGGAGKKVCRGDGGDAREEDEVREGSCLLCTLLKLLP